MEAIEEEPQKLENICERCGCELPISEWKTKPVVMCPQCGLLINRLENINAQPDLYAPIPDLKLRWVRFQEHIPFATKASAWLALGIRDAGKSSFLEAISVRYGKIIDLYGASDLESICWCKIEFEKIWRSIHGCEPKILLISSNNLDISSRFCTCHIGELTLKKIEEHDVITTCTQFFESEDQYFAALAKIVNILWTQRTHWVEPYYVLVREASNWLYSRTKVVRNDQFAMAEFIKAFRESRHHGLSMACDTLRFTAISKEIRDIADFTIIKRLGACGLPDDLKWLYKIFIPYGIMRMHVNVAIISTAKGSVGEIKFDYPKWHKTEHEDILKICEIEIKKTSKAVPDERNYTTGNFEHTEIISDYMETKSMTKTATNTARSYKTVYNHIQDHNMSVRNLGECKKCFNAQGEFSKTYIDVPKAGRPKNSEVAKRKKSDEKAPSNWVVLE
jgi:predicted RNA-binding Zn-ribbon protein involved in translation (DUF1610 family)